MKALTSVWLIVSLFVMPCVLNAENMWCCVILVVNALASFRAFKRHNPEYINQ